MNPSDFESWLKSASADRRPLVMGVLNVTPDSFSDGGRFLDSSIAVDEALRMVADGADLIDIGGESTRPGSGPVPADEQIRRVVPVIQGIVRQAPAVTLSIDTARADVAAAALNAGATLINDIWAGRNDPALLPLAARTGAPIALMHMQGEPATMQRAPHYQNVSVEVNAFLAGRAAAAEAAGVMPHRIVLDPGIGFGKTIEHNLQLLRELPATVALNRPVLIGTSRKGFIGAITGVSAAAERVHGTTATVAWAVAMGAKIARVHDVAAMVQVVKMIRAIEGSGR